MLLRAKLGLVTMEENKEKKEEKKEKEIGTGEEGGGGGGGGGGGKGKWTERIIIRRTGSARSLSHQLSEL